jgi:hypothetical protein
VIAPDWPEWRHEGILNYKGPTDFGKVLSKAMTMTPAECEEMNEKGWEEIKSKYLLSKVNELRRQVLESLVR